MHKPKQVPQAWQSIALLVTGLMLAISIFLAESKLQQISKHATTIDVTESQDEVPEAIDLTATNSTSESQLAAMEGNSSLPAQISLYGAFGSRADAIDKAWISSLFQQAMTASQQGYRHTAIAIYQQITALKPNHQMAAINLGLLLKKDNRCKEAVSVLDHAFSISGVARKGKILALLGACYMEHKQYAEAAEYFRRSIEYRPSHALTWRRYAESLWRNGKDYGTVLSHFDKAIALSPSNPKPILLKARYQLCVLDFAGMLATLTDADNALNATKKAQREYLELLVWSYLEQGKRNAATKTLQKLFSATKNETQSRSKTVFWQAMKHYLDNKYQRSIRELQKLEPSLKNSPLMAAEKAYLLAKNYFQTRKYTKVLHVLSAIQSNTILDHRMELLTAKTYASMTEHQQALAELQELFRQPIYTADVAYQAALTAAELELDKQAGGYLQHALASQPENTDYQLAGTKFEQRFGSLSKALLSYQTLAKQYPNNRKILRHWAKALSDAHLADDAMELYQQLVEVNPEEQDLYELAGIQYLQGNYTSAIQTLTSLLEQNSGHISARFLLARSWCGLRNQNRCQQEAQRVLKLDQQHSGARQLLSVEQSNPEQFTM